MYHPFSIAETIKTAWNIFKNNFVTIIVYSAISFFLLSVLAVITEFIILPEEFAGRMFVSFILIFVQAYTTLGLYKLIFTVIDSEYYEFEISQVLPGIKMIISYLIVVFLIAFLITTFHFLAIRLDDYPNIEKTVEVAGTFLGLFLALRIMFFNTFIVDDHSSAFESLRQSFDLTRGYFFKVLTILIIILVLIALPAIVSQYYPFVSLAIVFTYPFVNIVLAATYRKLVYSHQDVDDDIAETN
ncbi:MAG: hypothetical protein ABI367_03980 [Mucilaginibacter sp.]